MKRYIKSAKTLEDYENMGVFNEYQMKQIRKGLESGVDVSVYADPKYNDFQMEQIRLGLENDVDVSVYADPKYDEFQMGEIREGLETGVDVSMYADPKYVWRQMEEIRLGLENGVDVSMYADPKYVWGQMREIRKSLEGPAKPKRVDWKSLVNTLKREAEDGIDSLYELTDAGQTLTGIQQEVEEKLGIWLEPSIQGGRGGIWFYSSEDDSVLAGNYDYQTFNDISIQLAYSAKNKTEFKKAYKNYLQEILSDPDYAVE